jgi:HEXXH motif-containing protein
LRRGEFSDQQGGHMLLFSEHLVAEALVHETAHVKLDALDHLAPLLENGEEEGFRHPWREDIRPLRGVLLGAHAFLNVALFYQRMVEAGISPDESTREIDQRRREVAEALDILDKHAVFTPAGQGLFDRLVTANSR